MSSNGDKPDQQTTDPEMPRIEFPCEYPIKIIGHAVENFAALVIAVVERHAGEIAADKIKSQSSKNANYVSVTVTIEATGEEQLQTIFSELKAVESVKMVL